MNAALPTFPDLDARHGRKVALLVAAAFFMENLDATVIGTAVPAIAASFGVAPVGLSIGISAYLLALAVFIPVSGWIADRFGPRLVFTLAVLIFTLASVACGSSQSLPVFVFARVLQGIGGALMVPVGRLVVLRTTPKSDLAKAIATITWPGLAAPVLGPPLGGWIASTWNWHWIFFLNVPLGAAAMVCALRLIRPAPPKLRPFDWIGFFSSGGGLAGVMYGLELSSHQVIDRQAATLFIAGGMLSLFFALRHFKRAQHPLIDLSAFNVPTFRVVLMGGSVFRIVIGSAPFLLPLMFQLAFGMSMVESGFMLLAMFLGDVGIKPATTFIIRRFGFRHTLVSNGLLVALSFVAIAFMSPKTPVPLIIVVMVFCGMVRSMQFTGFSTLAFSDVTPEQTSGAATLFSMAQQLGAGIGIAFGAIALTAAQHLTGHTGDPGVSEFRMVFGVATLLALIALIDSLLLPPDAGHQVSRHSLGAAR